MDDDYLRRKTLAEEVRQLMRDFGFSSAFINFILANAIMRPHDEYESVLRDIKERLKNLN